VSVRIRAVRPEDLPVHFEQQRDPESTSLAAVRARDRDAFDAHWERILADPTCVIRTIVCDDVEVAGSVLSFLRDGDRQVGYWIGRAHWGRGIASAALGLLLEELPERPLFARVAAHNGASLRVLEKHGFDLIGEERDGDLRVRVLRLEARPMTL
jgi:RimJ/RimL family protein N-acetyltransferase